VTEEETKSEETKTEETKSKQTESDDESKTVQDEPKDDEKKDDEKKVAAKPTKKPLSRPSTSAARGWRPSWYRVGMGDLFIGVALLIAGTVVAMRTPTRWYGAFIVGTIETVHGLYLLSKKKQS